MQRYTTPLSIIILAFLMCNIALGQEEQTEKTKKLPPFSRIVISPRINVILTEGDNESIRLVSHRVDPDLINVEVRGKTLHLYLEDSRYTEKLIRVSRYEKQRAYGDASVTAYVTYNRLTHLEIRGDQEVTCNSPISAEQFTIKAYGKNEINLSSLKTGLLKMQLYGENRLHVAAGKAEYQKYKLYGENRIDTRGLRSYYTTATIFGESRLRINSQDELKINAFGESEIAYDGEALINRGLIFGKTNIRKMN